MIQNTNINTNTNTYENSISNKDDNIYANANTGTNTISNTNANTSYATAYGGNVTAREERKFSKRFPQFCIEHCWNKKVIMKAHQTLVLSRIKILFHKFLSV